MKYVPSFPRGSTFRTRLSLEVGLKGWAFSSQARQAVGNRSLNPLTCREIDVDDACVVEIECATDQWPLSVVLIDVRAEQGSEVVTAETIQISVSREVTNGSA